MVYAGLKKRTLGDIVKGREIGKIGKYASLNFVFRECPICGKFLFTQIFKGIIRNTKCRKCAASERAKTLVKEKHPQWNGGRHKTHGGYIDTYVDKDSPYHPMVSHKSYVKEHRLVMAQSLGRCLQTWEIVHHKNGIRDDNNIDNLELLPIQNHNQVSIVKRMIDQLGVDLILLKELIDNGENYRATILVDSLIKKLGVK